ncbi:MAG: glycine--tRNA ligase subunit beta [Chromatocurvus sp.]
MSTASVLVELGTEELPPTSLATLGLAFRDGIVSALTERGLVLHGDAHWYATPRRFAVLIDAVDIQAAATTLTMLGPPADRARTDSGEWSPAAVGFARKQGVTPEQLQEIDTEKGPRLGLQQEQAGAGIRDVLIEAINTSIAGLPIAKRMRWGSSRVEFVRPAHWVVALVDEDIVEGEVLGIATGRTTRGHRVHGNHDIVLSGPGEYVSKLEAARVVPDVARRRQMIVDQVEAEASALGAHAVIDDDLLDEVTGLVEWPVALTGEFESRFLDVPAEALISSMKEHQKYFHLVDDSGKLLPNFITISNIESKDPVQVIAGNERVIRPRLSDAAFFYDQDRKQTLDSRVESLRQVVFQKELGTLHDKTLRVAGLARGLAATLGADPAHCERAARLSKTDLVSEMVLEFADLQGIAGAYYARNDGEPDAVATALQQQYWPRFSGDRLPSEPVATCLALADRLDTLVGIFGIGQPPTGSRDPFALRRASLAVLRILVEKEIDFDLRSCLQLARDQYPADILGTDSIDPVLDYMLERFRAWFEDEGIPAEHFRAVAALGLTRPLEFQQRVHAVHRFSSLPESAALAAANKRVANILGKLDREHTFARVDPTRFVEAEEGTLWQSLGQSGDAARQQLAAGAYTEALAELAALRNPVDAFFDKVMVNADDESLRRNRLNLLHELRQVFMQVADISQLVVSR